MTRDSGEGSRSRGNLSEVSNLALVGRKGIDRCNNQDPAMLIGIFWAPKLK